MLPFSFASSFSSFFPHHLHQLQKHLLHSSPLIILFLFPIPLLLALFYLFLRCIYRLSFFIFSFLSSFLLLINLRLINHNIIRVTNIIFKITYSFFLDKFPLLSLSFFSFFFCAAVSTVPLSTSLFISFASRISVVFNSSLISIISFFSFFLSFFPFFFLPSFSGFGSTGLSLTSSFCQDIPIPIRPKLSRYLLRYHYAFFWLNIKMSYKYIS